jgi:hypothetical protein
MREMKIECNGLNSKIILYNNELTVKHKLKLPFYNKDDCLTFSLTQVKLIEFSTKSIIPPIICFLVFSSLVFVSIVYVKILPSFLKNMLIFSILGLILNFILIIIRLNFGSLKIELNNGVFFKVNFVKKREAEEFILKINY